MGIGLPVVGEGCCRIEMGEEGAPHGVSTWRVAASVKPGRLEMPVPPITAMWTGAGTRDTGQRGGGRLIGRATGDEPSYVEGTPAILRCGSVSTLRAVNMYNGNGRVEGRIL